MVTNIKDAKIIVYYDDTSFAQQQEYKELEKILQESTLPYAVVPAKAEQGYNNIQIQYAKCSHMFSGRAAIENIRNKVRETIKQN